MPPSLEVLSDRTALVECAQARVIEKIEQAVQARGVCSLALSGGSTPKPLYEALARQSLPLDRLHLFWGDERFVPADHSDSNYAMVKRAWLDPANFPMENVHSVDTSFAEPVDAAAAYEQELRRFFSAESETAVPAFDIVLLGMGDDGHTASLFPHTEALAVRDRLVTVGQKDDQPRITFTVPLLNQARSVFFLISGENKRPALAQVFAETGDAQTYPSRLIQPQGECHWLLDAAAGASYR